MQFVFFKILPKFSDFINSDDCIGKIELKSVRQYPVFFYDLNLINKGIMSAENMRNSGNYNYDYAQSFFAKDF